ncbi:hypothetical protein DM860_017542 [Cuscuta australis]|uniref:Glabrous enhancer-binding protein-like DBD domain-containing protein n=1 Tax=Cuscuta australis TaxID=267555 RepID=A0A328DUD4_9ASTE|nr:hypothetical protein DM860_017542 [Cuscuta australis]
MAMAAAARAETRPPSKDDEETSTEEPEEEDVDSELEGDQEKPDTQSSQKSQFSFESSESESDSKSANGSAIKPILKPTPLFPKSPESYSKSSSKRPKSKSVTEGEKKSGGRLWTDEDQVSLLRGMIQFKSEKGADPLAKMADFYEFLKDRLDFAFSKSQVQEKIRRLKKKFMKKGETSTSNPADSQIFQLSQKFWGSESGSGKNLDASSGKGKMLAEVKNPSDSKKIVESSNAVEKSKEKKKKAPKDEEIGARKKMKKEITVVEKDERTTSKGKDDQTIAERVGVQAIADEGKNDPSVGRGNGKQIAMNGVVQVEMGKREKDFRSKYPHFLNSFSVKYYPLTPEETLGKWKENAILLDCSVAEKVEKKWDNVWEEYGKLGRMVADLVSLQARMMHDEEHF